MTRWLARSIAAAALALALGPPAAHAVTVRGRVTNAQGVAVAGARIQLVESGKVVAIAYAGLRGDFEVRTGDAGRFTLLTYLTGYFPAIGESFYGGADAVVLQNVTLALDSPHENDSAVETGAPLPFTLLPMPASVVIDDQLSTRADLAEELRLQPGAVVVREGQWGSEAALYIRGGGARDNEVLVQGAPVDDLGGRFDFGTVSSTGIRSAEIDRGADSALYGSDARSAVVAIETPRGVSLRPRFVYSGDAGNLHTYRNEVTAEGTLRRLDYLGEFSRFDTSNALPRDEFHVATAVANVGYALASRLLLRGTLRSAVSSNGLPGAYDFYGVTQNGKRSDQDIYAQAGLEYRSRGNWHNLLQYGLVRKREEQRIFGPVGTPGAGGVYYGSAVTILGANGYSVRGAVPFAASATTASSGCSVNDRDEAFFQSDAPITRHLTVLFGFRYQDERGRLQPYTPSTLAQSAVPAGQVADRSSYTANGLLQGDIATRVFYSVAGAYEKDHVYGTRGTPRFGLTYVAVRPSAGKFHGTALHADLSRGVQAPGLDFQFGSLYGLLRSSGNDGAIQSFGVTPVKAEDSRSYDVRVDQNILGSKLLLHAGYFHSQFDHGIESVSAAALQQYFGIATAPALLASAYVNSLAYRAQGGELAVEYHPAVRVMLRGGYTYLASLVERSFTSDALQVSGTTTNPAFPALTIGATSPLVGARPFQRPPQTGFFVAQYSAARFSAGVGAAFASRSDDSTFLTAAFLLPNRNLDHGYAKLDAHATFAVTGHAAVFTQLENLLNDRYIAPLGFSGLPFTVRAGLKIRFGGD